MVLIIILSIIFNYLVFKFIFIVESIAEVPLFPTDPSSLTQPPLQPAPHGSVSMGYADTHLGSLINLLPPPHPPSEIVFIIIVSLSRSPPL